MSKGNLNTYGGKKNNFDFQHALLLINGAIQTAAQGGATEATLRLVLTALQNGQDYEAKLVRDSDTPSVTWLEVRIYNTQSGTWDPPVYYPAGSNTPGSPVLPIVYIDPTTLLSTIATNTTGINLEATQLLIKGVLDAIKVDTAAMVVDLAAMEALLTTIDSTLTGIKSDTAAMVVDLAALEALLIAVTRTASVTRITSVTSGNVAAGARSASFYNAHPTAEANVGGAVLKPGEVVNFSAGGQRDTLAQINWSTLVAADLLITTVV